jgi:formate hydrogenlyase subunit 6/NADH:ubiquinone oxidoreductase subunit I
MLIIEKEYCTGCKLCEKNCPAGAIKVIGRKANINSGICNDCYRCIYVCPTSAIKQETSIKEKVTFSNKNDLVGLLSLLSDLKKELSKIEVSLNAIERKK